MKSENHKEGVNYSIVFFSLFITFCFIVVVFFNINVNRLYSLNEEKEKKIEEILNSINQKYIELYSLNNPMDVVKYAKENGLEAIKIDQLNIIEFVKENEEKEK